MNQYTENQLFNVIDTIPNFSVHLNNLKTEVTLMTMFQIPQVKLQEEDQTETLQEDSNTQRKTKTLDKSKTLGKTKKIKFEDDSKKERRKRNFDKQKSKWSVEDQRNYWKFYIMYLINKPYMFISWGTWKCENIFKQMSQYVNKSPKQCKSKDQIIKSKWGNKFDIVEMALQQLTKMQNWNKEASDLIQQFQKRRNQQSNHMRLLDLKAELYQQKAMVLNDLYEFCFSQA